MILKSDCLHIQRGVNIMSYHTQIRANYFCSLNSGVKKSSISIIHFHKAQTLTSTILIIIKHKHFSLFFFHGIVCINLSLLMCCKQKCTNRLNKNYIFFLWKTITNVRNIYSSVAIAFNTAKGKHWQFQEM